MKLTRTTPDGKVSTACGQDFLRVINRVVVELNVRIRNLMQTGVHLEADHAALPESLPNADQGSTISIVTRSSIALGFTHLLPTEWFLAKMPRTSLWM